MWVAIGAVGVILVGAMVFGVIKIMGNKVPTDLEKETSMQANR